MAIARLSSNAVALYKYLLPAFWFIFSAYAAYSSFSSGEVSLLTAIPLLFIFGGYFLFKKYAFDLADEVIDEGDQLKIIYLNSERIVKLHEISKVTDEKKMQPRRINIHLDNSNEVIAFIPKGEAGLGLLSESTIFRDLSTKLRMK
ncbi:hypothetical protein [Chitinimonas sp. BJYL2]|uniref:hypothetical protein n=1 Tax=Chitinimonas sp. BJYL2 TaxID=2976696 RepID=UPI0022B3C58A|nr:hypothetical protein [Chitinimonas sp. BJYL2]